MPTIDQLAPAAAATDSDQFPATQNGITRKISRAQILAGMQTQLTVPSGTLAGRSTSGAGPVETISIGNNLNLVSGTLSAAASPFSIVTAISGVLPSSSDLVPLGQGGRNVSVTFGTFIRGMSGVSNLDGSQLIVTPANGTNSLTLADLAASAILKTGGSLSGPLVLGADPTVPPQAATKQYVDTRLKRSGDTMTGALLLAGDPTIAQQAATKNYVDNQSGFPRLGFTISGPIVLAGDPVAPLNPATKSYTDLRLIRAGDTMTGPFTLAGDPIFPLNAATKNYVDNQVTTALPLAGGALTGALSLSADPTSAVHAANRRYTDTKLARSGDTLLGPLSLASDPISPLGAATKNYVDTKALTSLPKTGGTMTGPVLLSGDPVFPAQAATKSYIDGAVATAMPLTGGTVTGPVNLTINPSAPAHVVHKQYVDTQMASSLPLAGGSLTGLISLASAPLLPLHAATKQYVDANPGANGVVNVKLAPCNAKLDGKTDDTAAFTAAYQLAPSGGTIYVPNGVTVIQPPANWGVPLSKRVRWIVDGTTLADGTPLADAIPAGTNANAVALPSLVGGQTAFGSAISAASSQAADFAVSHVSYVVNHTGGSLQTVAANSRTDTIVSQSPLNHIWSGFDRLVWNGTQTPSVTSPSRHVGRYVQAARQNIGLDGTGHALPQPLMWSACFEYRDSTGRPSSWSNGSVTTQMDWVGNGVDDAANRQIQTLTLGQHDTAGAAVEVSSGIGISLAPGSTGKIYRVLNVAVPYSVAVLDTTAATQLPGGAAIRMAAGHAIAFEPTNAINLSYSGTTPAIVAKYGSTTCAVGRGLAVAIGPAFSGSASISSAASGSVLFLVGSGQYTLTLPAAASVAPGTGYTFAAIGTGTVTISPAAGDSIEHSPVVLRQHDKYHAVSDGSSIWREIFRSNPVTPRFLGPPVLPSYLVSGLPASPGAGAKAFATNGRKPSELAGAGTGVEVFHDGNQWISVCGGQQISA